MPTGVYVRTEEYRQKQREAMLRRVNPGKNKSEETRKKISESSKKRKYSEETRKKHSLLMKDKPGFFKGKKHSKESKEKISKALTGEKHYNWKGGISAKSLYVPERRTGRYKQWKKKIFEKNGKICSICKKTEGRFEVDHIVPAAINKNKIYDVNNARILCRDCHKNTTTYGGRVHKLKKLKGFLSRSFNDSQ
jgi:hypothetical protein